MWQANYMKKTVQLLLWVTILAWATQVLFAQWARGNDVIAQVPVELGGSEKFVPGGSRFYSGATLELRGEVSVVGEEVKLKQVCRWADSDKAAFEPIADLVVLRIARGAPFRTVGIKELRETLHDAGVNLAVIRLAGATACTVSRTDVKFDERGALEQWVAAREAATTQPALIEAPTTQPGKVYAAVETSKPKLVAVTTPKPAAVEEKVFKTLRDTIVLAAAERLAIPKDQLQFHFAAADEKLLALSEPIFQFDVKPPRHRNLGEMTWDVSILADGLAQKASITGTVKAWQNQLIVDKPLSYKQVIRDEDVIEKRSLVDRLSDDPLVTREQVVGQMAGRELKSGTVLTARLIDPVILVKSGQIVSIMLTHGAIQAKTVARAMEQGTMGQTIRVKNEVTNNVFDVVVTGPQSAKLPASTETSDVAAIDTK